MKYYGIYNGVEIYTNGLDTDKFYYHQFSTGYSEIIITQKASIKDKFWSKEHLENKYFESHRYSINDISFKLNFHTTIPKNIILKDKTDFILSTIVDCSKIILNEKSKHAESYKSIYDIEQRIKIYDYLKSNNHQAKIIEKTSNKIGLYQFCFDNSLLYITKHISGEDVIGYDKMVSD